MATNIRTEDGMTNGSGNIIKNIALWQAEKPTGVIWFEFDNPDVGKLSPHDNRNMYKPGIKPEWTPILPITTQFAVGRNRAAQVIRKQFPLRPAVAKTIHRSQGETESKIEANFSTKRAIPHIHYVGLSRVTTIEGLYVSNLCDDKFQLAQTLKLKWNVCAWMVNLTFKFSH